VRSVPSQPSPSQAPGGLQEVMDRKGKGKADINESQITVAEDTQNGIGAAIVASLLSLSDVGKARADQAEKQVGLCSWPR
jgi:hypothetical protein